MTLTEAVQFDGEPAAAGSISSDPAGMTEIFACRQESHSSAASRSVTAAFNCWSF